MEIGCYKRRVLDLFHQLCFELQTDKMENKALYTQAVSRDPRLEKMNDTRSIYYQPKGVDVLKLKKHIDAIYGLISKPEVHYTKDAAKEDLDFLKNVTCYRCLCKGHYATTCDQPRKESTQQTGSNPEEPIENIATPIQNVQEGFIPAVTAVAPKGFQNGNLIHFEPHTALQYANTENMRSPPSAGFGLGFGFGYGTQMASKPTPMLGLGTPPAPAQQSSALITGLKMSTESTTTDDRKFVLRSGTQKNKLKRRLLPKKSTDEPAEKRAKLSNEQ